MPTVGTHTGIIALTGVICSSAICAGLAGPASAATTHAAAPAAAAAKGHVKSYKYGSGKRQKLTAYWHSGSAKPVVVMLHGGYWIEGSRSSWAKQARWWSAHGFSVVAMDYHYATQGRWATQRSDVLKALGWIRKHAKGIHGNAKRIVLLGSSAGGQMAVNTGTYGCGGCRVRAVVGLSPVTNPYASWKIGHDSSSSKRKKLATAAVKLAGCAPRKSSKKCWNRWVDMAARYRAGSSDAPMLLYHSTHDLVPASQSDALASALHKKGVSAKVRVVSGKKHGGGLMSVTGVRTSILAWVRAHT